VRANWLPKRYFWKAMIFSIFTVVALSMAQLLVIYPRFSQFAVSDSENEALRTGKYISLMLPSGSVIETIASSPALKEGLRMVSRDFQLWKLKVFSSTGEVVFSTDEEDVGQFNRNAYFSEEVARGKVYTKAVSAEEVTLEGQIVPIDVVETYVPLMAEGDFLGACEIYYDITARNRSINRLVVQASVFTFGIGAFLLLMIAVISLRAELATRKQEILQEQLIRSDRLAAIGTMVSGVAHEFNNINVTVMGFSQLALSRSNLAEDVRGHLDRINRAARRAQSITQNLLDFVRRDRSSLEKGNLAAAVREALGLVRDQYTKEGIVIRDRIEELPDSAMNRDQIVQVVLNILTNARHAMSQREEMVLTVETGVKESQVFVRVTDTGCGIPEDKLSQIFNPFYSTKGEYSGDNVMSKFKGYGLGLSVCHTIVGNHSGDVFVESQEGKGTAVTINLPLGEEGEMANREGDLECDGTG
jgi:signal transduction histidine kinase